MIASCAVILDISRDRASRVLVGLAIVAIVAGCSIGSTSAPSGASTSEPGALRVVTTTTVLADLVAQVGGTKVQVTSLVPKGGEVHTFDPTPSVLRNVVGAQLIVSNGLGLDDWLSEVVTDAGATAPVIALGMDVDPAATNPHLWMDVANARRYVELIRDALIAADSADAEAYRSGATAYDATLAQLDGWIRDQIATVPQANRRVVSFHDAFPSYAAAYGLTVVGTIVAAPGQDPSAGEVADLVAAIRAERVKAIISEAQFSDDLVRTIAEETGATVVSDLYDDTLGDPPVDTLRRAHALRHRADRHRPALRAAPGTGPSPFSRHGRQGGRRRTISRSGETFGSVRASG